VKRSGKELGLTVFSKSPSNAVTALMVKEGKDASILIKAMKARGIIVAEGQDQLKGKVIRIAHMGGITKQDVARTLEALKESLKEL